MKTKITLLIVVAIMRLTTESLGQVPSYVPSDGLVGWWPFNGNANDESGNGNDGTVNGAILTTDRNGNANSAYSFDGVSNYIGGSISNLNNTSSTTVSAWVKYIGDASGQPYDFFIQYGSYGIPGHDEMLSVAIQRQRLFDGRCSACHRAFLLSGHECRL